MRSRDGNNLDVDSILNFEKRTGVCEDEIEDFIRKVDSVNAAIRGMKASRICTSPGQ